MMGKGLLISLMALFFLFLTCWPLGIHAQSINVKPPMNRIGRTARNGPAYAKDKIMMLRRTSLNFRTIAAEPIPKNLGKKEREKEIEYSGWLTKAGKDLDDLADRWEAELLESIRRTARSEQMDAVNKSYSIKYLALQQRMQQDNRQFTLISNIMKVKHDTAKSAINNIR